MSHDAATLLAAYDAQLRIAGELAHATEVARLGPLHLARFGEVGFITYENLDGVDDLDALITAARAHYEVSDVRAAEWKTRGHDRPADLGERLQAQGFVPDDEETVMVGAAQLLAVDVPLPDGVTLRRAGDGGDLADDVRRASAMQTAVFGRPGGASDEEMVQALRERPDEVELWLAEVDGEVVCAGRLERVPGTGFAGIWGGACREDHRGRGIYRALTAARARSALRLGARYVNSDSTPMSRPVLERSGLLAVTTTTPYVWTR